jgi:UDP-N-acetylmuramoylalanine--D-glutamate ligase
MNIQELANKKILVAGVGIEGQATLRFLKHYFPRTVIGTADQKDGPDYLDRQNTYDIVIKSPGIQKKLIHVPYTTATNIFFANVKGMTIGVTGTKGKSTTASLIYDILKKAGKRVQLGGNIGKPLLDELRLDNAPESIYVCELSSYQLDDIRYSPHISVFINFFPEHMNYHGTVENYFTAKKRIVEYATVKDYFVFNPSYPQLAQLAKETRAQLRPFIDVLPFPDIDIPLIGQHNKDNVRAAVTVGNILHIQPDMMKDAVKNFQSLPHRLQNIGTYNNVTFYDDAISTTPESTVRAIESFKKVGTILVGGQDRGYDFSRLVQAIIQYNIPNVIYFPESGNKIAALLKDKKTSISLFPSNNMGDAVKLCYEYTPPGTVCLLSCASPSYSLWKNFEEKGNLFQQFVKKHSAQ